MEMNKKWRNWRLGGEDGSNETPVSGDNKHYVTKMNKKWRNWRLDEAAMGEYKRHLKIHPRDARVARDGITKALQLFGRALNYNQPHAFGHSEDAAMDYPDQERRAVEAYNKEAQKVFKQFEKFVKTLEKLGGVYHKNFK